MFHAISIRQPWAQLILSGRKPYEYRSWNIPAAYVGERLLLHASSTFGAREHDAAWMAGYRGQLPLGAYVGWVTFGPGVPGGPMGFMWPVIETAKETPVPAKARLRIYSVPENPFLQTPSLMAIPVSAES